MSADNYQLDVSRHGGPHVDRYNPKGALVGRYRPDKTPIPHKGRLPTPVPLSDYPKFDAQLARLKRR